MTETNYINITNRKEIEIKGKWSDGSLKIIRQFQKQRQQQ